MAKKKRTKRASSPKGTSGVNKSQAIRDFMATNPRAKPKAVAAALVEQGVQVTPMFVSAIKSASKKRGRRKVRGVARPVGRPRAIGAPRRSLTVDQLVAAKKFAASIGGVAMARVAIEALEAVTG